MSSNEPKLTRDRWDTLLLDAHADSNLEALARIGIIKATFPELDRLIGFGGGDSGHKDLWEHTKIVVTQTLRVPLLRWAALFHDCGKPECFSKHTGEITFRYHEATSARIFIKAANRSGLFTPDEIRRIAAIIRLLGHVEAYTAEWADTAVRRLALELGDLRDDVLEVARADCTSANPKKRQEATKRCHDLLVRFEAVKKLDETPPALPGGLGNVIMARLGFDANSMTSVQNQEMKRLTHALREMVEAGELPRSGDIAVYMEKLEGLL